MDTHDGLLNSYRILKKTIPIKEIATEAALLFFFKPFSMGIVSDYSFRRSKLTPLRMNLILKSFFVHGSNQALTNIVLLSKQMAAKHERVFICLIYPGIIPKNKRLDAPLPFRTTT